MLPLLSHNMSRYYLDIILWEIWVQIYTIQGYAIYCHEHVVVDSDVNNGVMTTPVANNGHHNVTELTVTSQWFGMW